MNVFLKWIMIAVGFACSVSYGYVYVGSVTDGRDSMEYSTVDIGNQRWMSQNLNFATDSSFCPMGECRTFGRLYKWNEATNVCSNDKFCFYTFRSFDGNCPNGYRLPRKKDVEELLKYVRSVKNKKNKAKDNSATVLRANNYPDYLLCLADEDCGSVIKYEDYEEGEDCECFDEYEESYIPQEEDDVWNRPAEPVTLWYNINKINDYRDSIHSVDRARAWEIYYRNDSIATAKRRKERLLELGGRGTDDVGFSAIPSINNDYDDEMGSFLGSRFWVATESSVDNLFGSDAYVLEIDSKSDSATIVPHWKSGYAAVRCLQRKNESVSGTHRINDVTVKFFRPKAKKVEKTFKDDRDGKTYKAVKIGTQFWMAENLNFAMDSSNCYARKEENCDKYGRLYAWSSAWNACPAGWHLPSYDEYKLLTKSVSQHYFEGVTLSLKSNQGWSDNDNGDDYFGFNALPAGVMASDTVYYSESKIASFWTSTLQSSHWARTFCLGLSNSKDQSECLPLHRSYGLSVRCVQDSMDYVDDDDSEKFKDERDGKTYKIVKIGSQTWMAENLNYKTSESVCPDGKQENCESLGRLYFQKDALNACPAGWHLPSLEEMDSLVHIASAFVGYKDGTARVLKTSEEWKWWNGSNVLGFNAKPAGYYDMGGKFGGLSSVAGFWTSNRLRYVDGGYIMGMSGANSQANIHKNIDTTAYSVRCVKNAPGYKQSGNPVYPENGTLGTFTDSRDGNTYKTVVDSNLVWMTENLRIKTSRSKCVDGKPENCEIYGALYQEYDGRSICPIGWRLPYFAEFREMKNRLNSLDILNLFDKPAGAYVDYDGVYYFKDAMSFFWIGDYGFLRVRENEFEFEDFYDQKADVYISVRCVKEM
ncbi:MAG: hypothetical protein MJZ25_05410 [Fibrobacter sp.]|nr:hypothetical protein [Fibrobacter sp.]